MAEPVSATLPPASGPNSVTPAEVVLVVDDSRAQRRILSSYLSRWGYSVLEAGSGAEALSVCDTHKVDLIVSDWMMPGMTGLELCEAFRSRKAGRYGYFILLTSKSEKVEIARGLDVGADDFLTKPVTATEFRARIRAGERILQMERELTEKNRMITQTLEEISALYDVLDRDLLEARRLQQSLVRERHRNFGAAEVTLLLRPSGRVGGDLVGYFQISETVFGFYSIDVSGHGIAAALLTARLAGHFSGNSGRQNLALKPLDGGGFAAQSPAFVAEHLNTLMLLEMETDHYFTMLLGHLDLSTGRVVMAQCGHPYPALQRGRGQIENIGQGGLPVGLIPNAGWQDFEFVLRPGDRLFLPSDGITELRDTTGVMLEEDGLSVLLRQNRNLRGPAFFETLMWDLGAYAGDAEFPDDISGVLIDFSGPKARTGA